MSTSKKVIGVISAFVVCSLVVFFQNCSGGGSSSSSTAPFVGQWEYDAPGSTATAAKGIVLNMDGSGNMSAYAVYAYQSGNSVVGYYQKSSGTYTNSGNVFTFTYTYQTCAGNNPEQYTIQANPSNANQLIITDGNTTYTMNRTSSGSSNLSVSSTEDKGCNIVSNIQAKSERLPASLKESYITFFGHYKKGQKK